MKKVNAKYNGRSVSHAATRGNTAKTVIFSYRYGTSYKPDVDHTILDTIGRSLILIDEGGVSRSK
jgi:hypothetical protein